MSDDFIPLNQSTPVQGKWQNRSQQGSYQNNWHKKTQQRRGHHQKHWGNNSQHSNSFVSDGSSSYSRENKSNIDAYLHPSMLKDPWEHLRKDTQ
ncbi:unnamed protein product, partial [Brenthis ino]